MAVPRLLLCACALLLCSWPTEARRLLADTPWIAPNTTNVDLHGYTLISNVGVYLGFSQDVCDMSAALSQATPDFDTALEIYQTGKNSPSRRGGYRSLKGFSNGTFYAEPTPFRQSYIERRGGNFYFLDAAMEEAKALSPADASAAALKAVPRMIMLNFMMHEMEEGLSKTLNREENHTDPLRGGAHNLEESWALYHGSEGCGFFALAQSLAAEFGTLRDVPGAAWCSSSTHERVLGAFKKMRKAALAGNTHTFTKGRDNAVSGMVIPFIQATLKAAYAVSADIKASNSPIVHLAEARAYWRSIEPVVAIADEVAGAIVNQALRLDRVPSADTYTKVKSALESAYPALGLRARAIGSVGAKRQSLKCNGGAKARSN